MVTTQVSAKKGTLTSRNNFWCPIQDCGSGSVQKIEQHLDKVHKLDKGVVCPYAKEKACSVSLMLPSSKGYVPTNTQKNTDWSVRVFQQWQQHREGRGASPKYFKSLTIVNLYPTV